jgi:hypothetical protein
VLSAPVGSRSSYWNSGIVTPLTVTILNAATWPVGLGLETVPA